ncbi:MATE family efflux transporter [Malacoplasma iowae]|uniref:MATE family efflux transporter n=1 Tax=Malacoplasma iowae TaxID=2116 RepID=UPI00022C63A7|nr:MATE family efflux transporter [Malacoplasma iowae]EGZ31347.1 hypothetical protein GUU_02436 [Malacoplasma iowae 695]
MSIVNKIFSEKIDANVNDFYAKQNMWKLSAKVVIPTLLLTLLFGIYIFIDQLLMIYLIPKMGIDYYQKYFDSLNVPILNQMDVIVNKLRSDNIQQSSWGFTLFNNQNFISYAASLIGIFNLIVISFGYLISTGASVLYSRAYAKKDHYQRDKVYQTSFYSTIIFSLFATVLMIFIQQPILSAIIPVGEKYNYVFPNSEVQNSLSSIPDAQQTITSYVKYYYSGSIKQTGSYLYFLNSTIIFMCLSNLFSFFLRSEGKNIWITFIAIFANMFNIVLDVILIYSKLGVIGSGIATFIGFMMNCFGLIIYIIILQKKSATNVNFVVLKQFRINFKILIISISLGSGTFLREISLAVANVVYLTVLYSTFNAITNGPIALGILTKLVATPLYNLLFFAIFGIVDGMRPILSYNYANKEYNRVKKAYWIGTLYGIIYSLMVNVLIFSSLASDTVLNFFAPVQDGEKNQATKMLIVLLMSMMFQMPFISLSVGGLSLFQSTGKNFMNFLLSLMQGSITFYPVIYSMSAIAKHFDSYFLMMFTGFLNIALSSLIIFFSTIIYIYQYMGKKEKNNDPAASLNKQIKKLEDILKVNKNKI